jgi:hypothetical protein
MTDKEEARLLELPDSCLVEILQHTADDLQSLYSAARAHSRLCETAALALRSISVGNRVRQQRATSLLLYLAQHGQHADSLTLADIENYDSDEEWEAPLDELQLPANMQQLNSLHLTGFSFRMQPGCGSAGLLGPAAAGAGAALKQLRLANCMVVDGEAGLVTALTQLPRLEHLSLERTNYGYCALTAQTLLSNP